MILTRLRAGALAALVVSFASLPAFAQLTPLFQSGVMTRARDLPMMTREGQIQDAAAQGVLGDANGRGVNPFAITDSNALGICTHTAPTGSSHHSLCLGHDANGSAIMTIDGSSYSLPTGGGGGGAGTVTSVGFGGPGGIFSTSGGPITSAGTLSFSVVGTAGAIPYFSSTSQLSTSGLLTANMPVIGGGASAAPTVGTVTGTGTQFVVSNAPTLVAPALGTPSSVTLTNGAGLPISSGVSGLAAGVATWLAAPSSANLAAALTNETGSGAAVFATSPTFITPALGTIASGNLSAGSVTATGGSTANTLANLAVRAISVKDFGALCDGSTNDATAINAAFVANPTGVILMPANCKWTSTITLPTTAFKLIGGGWGAPWLCRVGNDSTCMKFSSGGSTAGSAIYDFSIDATGTDGGSHTGINFDATKAPQNFTMHNWQLVNSCNGMLISLNNNFTAENGIVQTLGDSCAYGIKWDTDPAVGTGVFLNLNNVLIACSSDAATATRGFVWDGDSTTLVANALTILSCKDLFVAENTRSHATKFPVYAQITNSAFEGAYTGVACKFSAARHISIFGTYCFNNKPNTDTDSLQLSYDAASSGGASQFFQMTDSFVMQAHNRCAFIDWANVQISSTLFVGCAVTAGSPGIKIGAHAVAVSLGSGNQIAATAATYAVETTASCTSVTIAADVYMNSLAGAGRLAVNDLGSCVQGLAPAFGTVQVSSPSGATTLTTKGYNYFTMNEALAAPQLTFAPAVAGGLLQFLLKNTSTGAGVFASMTVATGTANSSIQMGVDDAGGLGTYIISGSGRTEGLYINTAAGPINFAPAGALQIGGVAGVSCSGSPTGSFASVKGIVTHC